MNSKKMFMKILNGLLNPKIYKKKKRKIKNREYLKRNFRSKFNDIVGEMLVEQIILGEELLKGFKEKLLKSF